MSEYKEFLNSKCAKQWKKIGIERRAGVLVPLFSVYSKNSIGTGEIPDIKLIVDWCKKTNHSIIQLLPMNDTGFKFTPYDAESTFALDPLYLAIEKIKGADLLPAEKAIAKLKSKFKPKKRVDYKVKEEKLKVLWKIFESIDKLPEEYEDFAEKNSFWVKDYASFKVLKEKNGLKSWEEWDEKYKYKEGDAVEVFNEENFEEINFHIWLQFQLSLQFKEVKEYAGKNGVFIQGDLPFLVSRDSSDVWSNQNYFKLNISSGAPPDMYFAKGQRWGMPPYSWEHIKEHKYDYLVEKVRFASGFYDMFRIDHFVGLFRLWTIPLSEPHDTFGLNGVFDPEDEDAWKEHGQSILKVMTESSDMLPCAEDLGVVPLCSYETLEEFSVPGMDVQRWTRDWGKSYDFKPPEKYRKNSVCIISSHDMTPLKLWWEEEASTVDAVLVEKHCSENDFSAEEVKSKLFDMGISKGARLRWKKEINTPQKVLEALGKSREEAWMFYDMHLESYSEKNIFQEFIGRQGEPQEEATKDFIAAALKKAAGSRSIFTIQLLQDILCLGEYFKGWDKWDLRVNTPGTMSEKNWSIVMPLSLEQLQKSPVNDIISAINKESGRS